MDVLCGGFNCDILVNHVLLLLLPHEKGVFRLLELTMKLLKWSLAHCCINATKSLFMVTKFESFIMTWRMVCSVALLAI